MLNPVMVLFCIKSKTITKKSLRGTMDFEKTKTYPVLHSRANILLIHKKGVLNVRGPLLGVPPVNLIPNSEVDDVIFCNRDSN